MATNTIPVNQGASSTYANTADEMQQGLDAAIAAVATETIQAAGPSLPLGQQSAQGVVRPAVRTTQGTQMLSNETLVQSFRQTSGE